MCFIDKRNHQCWVNHINPVGFFEMCNTFCVLLHLNQINLRTPSNVQLKLVDIIIESCKVNRTIEDLSHGKLLFKYEVARVKRNAEIRIAHYDVVVRHNRSVACSYDVVGQRHRQVASDVH